MMTYGIIIGACFLVYTFQQGPKVCNCFTSQNVLVVDRAVLYVNETKRKCALNLNLEIKISPEQSADFLTKPYHVKLVSAKRGVIHAQVVIGSPRIQIKENFVMKRKDKLWVEINSSGTYLVTMNTFY